MDAAKVTYQSRMGKRLQALDQKDQGTRGRFGKLNPCYGCGKSAGRHYFSHRLTDDCSPQGISWGDLALCLCPRCAQATDHMTEPVEFARYAYDKGQMSREALAYWQNKKAEVR